MWHDGAMTLTTDTAEKGVPRREEVVLCPVGDSLGRFDG